MPRIFDNIEQKLLPALQETLEVANHADFCVGYFNLRGWKKLDSYIESWAGGESNCCRLLIGMPRLAEEELRLALAVVKREGSMDNQAALRLKKKLVEEFRGQLMVGMPSNEDETGLRRLAAQVKSGKVIVKFYLRHPLHAKLYLLFRPDPINPIVGYLGSSNLTLAGISRQGELNIDVLDADAGLKLARWFEDRWNDRWCLDVSEELVQAIEGSWAREELIPPYHIYLKIAYHLSQEARAGLSEFRIPRDFGNRLFEFQTAAVKIAAHHLNKRDGVLIGDVVGLGKTLMATAVARIFEDDRGWSTLIVCPKNLVRMWQDYVDEYGLHARVISLSTVSQELPNVPARFRLIIIDESHNLRNREGVRYRAIQEYIAQSESRCILLSATPYNKTYLDLSNQLRLFVPDNKELGIRPDRLLREMGEIEFVRRHQCLPRSLAAFEHSDYADDWREIMRLYMVRRTRSFIMENYAETDPDTGRKYLTFEDGTLSYFPKRIPKKVDFTIDDADPADQYARLYSPDVVDTINGLGLPRYGLGNYIEESPPIPPTQAETRQLDDLSRAGIRLMGFCRTNLFKRLESSGEVFLQSIERHVLRNYVFLHAIEHDKELPIGTLDAGVLDARVYDEDADMTGVRSTLFDDDDTEQVDIEMGSVRTHEQVMQRAAEVYEEYSTKYRGRFRWLRASLFIPDLAEDLSADAAALLRLLAECGNWDPEKDSKLDSLFELLTKDHPKEKVIVFTQFADTVRYLERQLESRGLSDFTGVTGDSPDPTEIAWRFSPVSNKKRTQVAPEDELRAVIATDVLSEGQNLQDCYIVVNYDLPWAIVRLVQRVGRVDRIGQQAENILCYSFLPADGVERILRLRARVRQRLQENAEVVGTDEAFFEDDRNDQAVLDLYNEKTGILDGDVDTEVDLASYAFQIWKNAIEADPSLQKAVTELPDVVYSTKTHTPSEDEPEGVLVYMRTAEDNDALAWIDRDGNSITESQLAVLRAAECSPDTPALPHDERHHEMVAKGVELISTQEESVGGGLGRPSGARFRTYERLKRYAEEVKGQLFDTDSLHKAIEEIYRHPLRESAKDTLNRQLRSGISDEALAGLVIALRDEGRLCLVQEEEDAREPRIICSMGLSTDREED
ncbi:MAG: NgoFVII family restriction endonuclease [Chloroflexi bacterium]|nr:NgoFVII family restriction endonuclease [Chloroflexota bacterium]